MNEDIKKALEICLNSGSCEGCPYLDDPDCELALKKGSLDAIQAADITIGYLTELNTKLAEELKNSLELKEGDTNG